MKKLALFLISLFLLTSCGNKNENSIKYDGPETINIVLSEILNLNAGSESGSLIYHSDNKQIVYIHPNGYIEGRGIGETNITLKNDEDELKLHVVVSLFEEPTLEFGKSMEYIKKLYGKPRYVVNNNVLVYGSGDDWYSPTVWEMDFFFNDNKYYECNLYFRQDYGLRFDQYIEDKYFFQQEVTDTIDGEIRTLYIYLDKPNPDDATVIIGKQYDAGKYDDLLLVYAPFEMDKSRSSSYIDFIKRNRKHN